MSQNASRRHAVEERTLNKRTIGTTSREIVFGKRSFENAPKEERLFVKTNRTQDKAPSSSGFIKKTYFSSDGSSGFNIADTSDASSSQTIGNPASFSFAPISGESNSGQVTTSSQTTSTMFSFDADKPQAPTQSPEKTQGISTSTTSPLASFTAFGNKQQKKLPFGTSSINTSRPGFSFPSILPASKSSVSAPGFPVSKLATSHQESTASSIGFPVTPVSTLSQPTSVIFKSKFGQSGFSFAKGNETSTPPAKPTQPFSATTDLFGNTVGQDHSTTSKDNSFHFKRSGKSPDERTGSDISGLKALVIREIPHVFNKNAWLKRFYCRFGEVMKVVCNPPKNSATVTFKIHVSISKGVHLQ